MKFKIILIFVLFFASFANASANIEDANCTDYITYNYGHYKDGGFITDYSYTQEQYMALISKNKVPVQDVTSESDVNKKRAILQQYGQNFNDLADASEVAVVGSFAVAGVAIGGFAAAPYIAAASTGEGVFVLGTAGALGTKGCSKILPKCLKVPNIVIRFGKGENQVYHAFRHVDDLGLDRSLVQSTIEKHFKSVSSQVVSGKPFNQIIEVGGKKIQYTAYRLADGTFNIGRIHGVN